MFGHKSTFWVLICGAIIVGLTVPLWWPLIIVSGLWGMICHIFDEKINDFFKNFFKKE